MIRIRVPSRRLRQTSLAALLCVALAAPPGAGAADGAPLPTLGANSIFSLERETRLGRTIYDRLQQRGLIETDPLLDRYINDLGFRLLAGLPDRQREYRFFIVRDDGVNAFALPGGFIGVNRGLIRQASREDQLAAVMAHEIAHVRLSHGLDMMRKGGDLGNRAMLALLAGLLLGGVNSELGAAVAYGGIAGSRQALVNFTRENEFEADRLGIELLQAANFDAEGMIEFFGVMSQLAGSSEYAGIEYLRTHPLGSNRVAEAMDRARRLGKGADQVEDFSLFKDYLLYSSRDFIPDQGSDFLRALALMRRGEFSRADQRLVGLYERDNENIWYGIAFAENLENLGREAEAELIYRRLLDIFPDDYVLSMRLLRLLRQGGHNQSALVIARALENQYPDDKQVYFELSEIYQALGRSALRLMAQAEFHRISGNPRQAIRLYDEVLKSPDVDLTTESRAREKRLLLLER